MRRAYNRFMMRLDEWALGHPWGWGVLSGVGVGLSLLILHLPYLVALGGGVVGLGFGGWSMSCGPGRRITERFLERRRSRPN